MTTEMERPAMCKSKTIAQRLADHGMIYAKDDRSKADSRYSVFENGKFVARMSAKEAAFFLEDLTLAEKESP